MNLVETRILPTLERRAANNAWSNLRLHRACARLSAEEYAAPRTSFFPSIPETLNHLHLVDAYYMDAIEEGGRGLAVWDDELPYPALADLPAMTAAQRALDVRLIAIIHASTEADLLREVRLARRDRVQIERLIDVLLHLDTHQTHHRGQVHAMLSGTSVAPPPLDEFFLREELPLREHELRELGLPLV